MDDSGFSGFHPPLENWSKLPHQFFDLLPRFSSKAEVLVVLYIFRHTWGYREYDQGKKITTDEFINGRKRRNGSRIDSGTGMSAPSVRAGLKAAEKHGFITVEVDETDKARIEKRYGLNMMVEKNFPLMVKSFPSDGKKLSIEQRKVLRKVKKKDSTPTARANGSKPNPLYDAIAEVWQYEAALNADTGKMLTGVATKKGWKEYNITPAMTPDEVRQWGAWWQQNNPGMTMLAQRSKVQSSVYAWRKAGSPAAGEKAPDSPYSDAETGD